MFGGRLRAAPGTLGKVSFNTIVSFVALVAFYNPTGYCFSYWIWESVIRDSLYAFWDGLTQVEQYGVIGAGLIAFLLMLTVLIKYPKAGKILSILIAVGAVAGLIGIGMRPMQALVGVILVSMVAYSALLVPRHLGAWGFTIIVGICAIIVWQLTVVGWFNPANLFAVQWAVILVLSVLFGFASSNGAILRWYQDRQPTQDVDTQAAVVEHDDNVADHHSN